MKPLHHLLLLSGMVSILSACGGDSNNNASDDNDELPGGEEPPAVTVIEATNLSTGSVAEPVTVYYDLDTEQALTLTDAEAETNGEWDIAFNRTKVLLNRFAETPVAAYFSGNTDEFYDAEGAPIVERFINATAQTEYDGFVALEVSIPDESEFHSDEANPAIADWYNYDMTTHQVSADAETYFIVESDGAYSKFHVTDMVQDGFGLSSITLGIAYQPENTETFAGEQTLQLTSDQCNEAIYVDADTSSSVNANDDWDFAITCANGLIDFDINIAADARAINDPMYSNMDGVDSQSAYYFPWVSNVDVTYAFVAYGDSRSPYGWGNYGVNGGHVIWQNYAVYIIQTASAYYKFQITNYYDSNTDQSGTYSFRYIELDAPEATE